MSAYGIKRYCRPNFQLGAWLYRPMRGCALGDTATDRLSPCLREPTAEYTNGLLTVVASQH